MYRLNIGCAMVNGLASDGRSRVLPRRMRKVQIVTLKGEGVVADTNWYYQENLPYNTNTVTTVTEVTNADYWRPWRPL